MLSIHNPANNAHFVSGSLCVVSEENSLDLKTPSPMIEAARLLVNIRHPGRSIHRAYSRSVHTLPKTSYLKPANAIIQHPVLALLLAGKRPAQKFVRGDDDPSPKRETKLSLPYRQAHASLSIYNEYTRNKKNLTKVANVAEILQGQEERQCTGMSTALRDL
jgi:hypothetical protein